MASIRSAEILIAVFSIPQCLLRSFYRYVTFYWEFYFLVFEYASPLAFTFISFFTFLLRYPVSFFTFLSIMLANSGESMHMATKSSYSKAPSVFSRLDLHSVAFEHASGIFIAFFPFSLFFFFPSSVPNP